MPRRSGADRRSRLRSVDVAERDRTRVGWVLGGGGARGRLRVRSTFRYLSN
jgi:hypothetical protein